MRDKASTTKAKGRKGGREGNKNDNEKRDREQFAHTTTTERTKGKCDEEKKEKRAGRRCVNTTLSVCPFERE